MYLELLLEMWNKVLKLNCDDQFKFPQAIFSTIKLKVHCPHNTRIQGKSNSEKWWTKDSNKVMNQDRWLILTINLPQK